MEQKDPKYLIGFSKNRKTNRIQIKANIIFWGG